VLPVTTPPPPLSSTLLVDRWLTADKSGLDFGVIVGGTSAFKPDAWLLPPSDKLPMREPDEPQTWLSPSGQLFEKTLVHLKAMVFTLIYLHPGIQKVLSCLLVLFDGV
jgi:hypothetical protein